jgi:hypothetical protein
MNRPTLTAVFLAALPFLIQSAQAQAVSSGSAVITLGTYYLQENKPNQTITINIAGGAQISGMNFNLQIGDGGPAAGGTPGPVFTGLDLVDGTVFQSDHADPLDLGSIPQALTWDIVTAKDGDFVNANGLLATVTVDTTGFSRGQTFPFSIASTRNGGTNFIYDGVTPVPTSLADGTIVIVPEPSSFMLLVVAGVAACGWAGRRAMQR